jgi:hypothetical protein
MSYAPRISFSPSVINLQPSSEEQTVSITVSLQEPIISPSGSDIGLTIRFTSSLSGITIPDVIWQPDYSSTIEGVPSPKTVTLTVPANQMGSGTNVITPLVVTNSELYHGFVPAFTVNYTYRFSMGSLYTNNAQVYYKSGSLSSGIGSVRNHRARGRRT